MTRRPVVRYNGRIQQGGMTMPEGDRQLARAIAAEAPAGPAPPAERQGLA